ALDWKDRLRFGVLEIRGQGNWIAYLQFSEPARLQLDPRASDNIAILKITEEELQVISPAFVDQLEFEALFGGAWAHWSPHELNSQAPKDFHEFPIGRPNLDSVAGEGVSDADLSRLREAFPSEGKRTVKARLVNHPIDRMAEKTIAEDFSVEFVWSILYQVGPAGMKSSLSKDDVLGDLFKRVEEPTNPEGGARDWSPQFKESIKKKLRELLDEVTRTPELEFKEAIENARYRLVRMVDGTPIVFADSDVSEEKDQ
ncbi:MAG: hypothetical protein KDA61_22945, partial [Planctomycetales bacterium]|nr:hypothetical protein [Planctomycetales bacterium]